MKGNKNGCKIIESRRRFAEERCGRKIANLANLNLNIYLSN